MGRRDAVQFTLELVAEWRRLGARVTFEPGWETRGNGTSANYEGAVVHHTVGASSAARPLPSKNVLKDGRTGLKGPLCNSAGPWCEDGDPHIHVMAAHPANHAGASGGKGTKPLPVTSLFNPLTWGHEIDYLGDRPMTKGQEKAALIVAAGVANVLGRSTDYVRAHAETSVTGKWDPGHAPGKTIDMTAFRRSAANIAARGGTSPEEFDVLSPENAAQVAKIVHDVTTDVLNKRGVTDAGNYARESRDLLAQLLAKGPGVDIDPADIAAAIPEGIAQQVADLLAQRLAA